jgi:hypothetical protein
LRNAGSEEFAAVVFMGLSIARLKQGSLCLFFVGRKQIEPNKTTANRRFDQRRKRGTTAA